MQESTDIFSLRSGTVLERRCMPQLIRGLPVGRVFAFRDITHQAEIQASLRLAARVFESSLDAIFIADPQGSILRMNPGCERLVRGAAADWLGRCACDLFALQPGAAWCHRCRQRGSTMAFGKAHWLCAVLRGAIAPCR